MPYADKPVPIVATVAEAAALGAQCLAIGVAPAGGKLPPEWKEALLEALALGMHVEAGLHDELGARSRAGRGGRRRAGSSCATCAASPPGSRRRAARASACPSRIVHAVGTDCAIGKMTVTLELTAAARAAGEHAVFVPTGQIGISIAGWGIAVDHVIADYVAGAAERLVLEGAERGDLLLRRGTGRDPAPALLRRHARAAARLHAARARALHEAGASASTSRIGRPAGPRDPAAAGAGRLLLRLTAPLRPAPVVAIALSTRPIASDDEARAAIAAVEAETGLVCDDPVRFGAERLWRAVEGALA